MEDLGRPVRDSLFPSMLILRHASALPYRASIAKVECGREISQIAGSVLDLSITACTADSSAPCRPASVWRFRGRSPSRRSLPELLDELLAPPRAHVLEYVSLQLAVVHLVRWSGPMVTASWIALASSSVFQGLTMSAAVQALRSAR